MWRSTRLGRPTATAWPRSETPTTTSSAWSTRAWRGGTKPPVYACDYSDELDAVDAHGHVPVPTGPGLGTPLDWDFLNASVTERVVYE